MTLEAHLPDGSRVEFQQKVGVVDVDILGCAVGNVLPIRYDPDRPGVVVLDVPAIRAAREGARNAREQQAIERARRQISGD